MNAEMKVVSWAAKALDRAKPGWADRVDVQRIDLWSSDDCVLGQVFGNYFYSDAKPLRRGVFSAAFAPVPWRVRGTYHAWVKQICARTRQEHHYYCGIAAIDDLDLRRPVVVPDFVPSAWAEEEVPVA